MNKDLISYVEEFGGDVFVGDYTEFAKTHPECKGKGVCVDDKPFPDLNTLHIINRRQIPVGAVNFERCKDLVKDEKGDLISQCEGLCFALRARLHGWVLLIELKYCMDKNIGENVDAGRFQLENTLLHLRGKGVIEKSDRVYWVLSIPDHSELEPFNSFIHSQDDLLTIQQELGVVSFFRQNEIEIHTDSHLMVPKK